MTDPLRVAVHLPEDINGDTAVAVALLRRIAERAAERQGTELPPAWSIEDITFEVDENHIDSEYSRHGDKRYRVAGTVTPTANPN
jgi:hypothetical protein